VTPRGAGILLAAVAVLGLSAPARAESPRDMMMEIKFGPYYPNIDAEFATKQPFKDIFGGSQRLMSRLEFDYEFFTGFGVAAVGATVGYSQFKGKGLLASGEKSGDSTTMHLLPLSLDLIYRFDWLWQRHKVPFVPYAKGGIDCYVWWVTNGVGDVARASGGARGRGATFGGHATVGLSFVLDALAPQMAQTFDVEMGVNNTMIFVEYVFSWVDDFGSSRSWDLGSRTFLAGLAFEF
jgi:hypothetical protein